MTRIDVTARMGAVATREEIEAQIESAPTDDDAFLILGDLLQLEGDPRGELISLQKLTVT